MGHDVPVAGNFAREEHLKIPMRRFGPPISDDWLVVMRIQLFGE